MQEDRMVLTKATLRAAALLDVRDPDLALIIGLRPQELLEPNALDAGTPPRERALLFLRLYRAIVGILGDDAAHAWFHAPNRHLRGVPSELARTREGLERVVTYVEMIADAGGHVECLHGVVRREDP